MAIQQSTTGELRELALFAGAGGGILGGHLLGWRTVCAVERDAYCASVLAQRQNDGVLAPFPIWSDVETFDGKPWRGFVDVVSGGFPCTDISCAGKGAGIDGAESGLWKHMARVVREVQPRYVFVENSPAITTRGLGRVLGDLAALGFDADWEVLGTQDTGGVCWGERMWIVASPNKSDVLEGLGTVQRARRKQILRACKKEYKKRAKEFRMEMPPRAARMDTQVAHQMERVAAIGNGQDPYLAAAAWRILQ
jgi:DNA (cytosine-5)-methyltransferase 1